MSLRPRVFLASNVFSPQELGANEKIDFQTQPPKNYTNIKQKGGAVAELMRYLNELENDETQLLALWEYFQDIEKKLPRELTTEPEGIVFSDPNLLRTMLGQTRSMLLRKLTSPKGFQ